MTVGLAVKYKRIVKFHALISSAACPEYGSGGLAVSNFTLYYDLLVLLFIKHLVESISIDVLGSRRSDPLLHQPCCPLPDSGLLAPMCTNSIVASSPRAVRTAMPSSPSEGSADPGQCLYFTLCCCVDLMYCILYQLFYFVHVPLVLHDVELTYFIVVCI